MELPIVFALLTSFIITISSHPKSSDIIPKDYYKRQVLQPIPGYIPVYIKADGVPLIRTEVKKPTANVHTQKTSESEEKNLPRLAEKTVPSESDVEKSAGEAEGVKTSETMVESPDQTKTTLDHKEDEVKAENAEVDPENRKTSTAS